MSYRDNCSVGYVSLLFIVFQSLLICLFYKKPEPALIQGRNYLNRAKEITSSQYNHSSKINSQCVAMFNIGYGSSEISQNWNVFLNQELKKLEKTKEKFAQQTDDYLPFSKSLVKLVDTTNDGSLTFRNGTRLQNMEGKLPYVPCNIRDYSNRDFQKCVKVLNERNKPLWIAYFGDSKARNMLFYMLNSTHSFMNWTMNGNSNFTEKSFFSQARFYHYGEPIEYESASGERMTLIVTAFGIMSGKNKPRMPTNILDDWLNQSGRNPIPDILIVEFGSWHFNWINIARGSMHDSLLQAWKQLHKILIKLSDMMAVLCHISTRVRNYGVKHHMELYNNLRDKVRISVSSSATSSAVTYIDQVMKHGTRRSNIIFWDSTLPFIIASISECELLVKHNHSSVAEEGKIRSKHFLPFMCNDLGHKTRALVHDERSIILNLACNEALFNLEEDYCCTR